MVEVKIVPEEEWDKFVEQSPQGTFLSTTKWMKLFNEPYELWGYYRGNNLLGGFGGFSKNMPLCAFQGILIAPTTGKYTATMSLHNEVATALLDVLPNEFTNHYTYPDIRPFLWAGYKPTVKYTYLVNLHDWLLENLEKQTRYEINHTDIEVNESNDIQFFDALYESTFTRKGMVRPVSTELVCNVYTGMKGQLFIAKDNTSAVMMVKDSKRGYYLFGASDGSGTSSKCLWEALQSMRIQGCTEVDMCGCNNREIGLFKRGFGGELKPYYGVYREV